MTAEDHAAQPRPSTEVSGGQGVQIGDRNELVSHHIQTYIDQRQTPARAAQGSVVVGEVPQRPPAFEPRPDLIEALSRNGPGITVVRALTGMRGVGKTQLAAEYARCCIDTGWRLVAWVNAGSIGQVLDGLGLIASRLRLGEQGKELETLAAAVRQHLEVSGENCLVVFNNVVDLQAIGRFLPAAGRSQVIITSNQTEAAGYGTAVAVEVFTPEEALSFLARRVGDHDAGGAAKLATELGYLPLALAQAAAVIATQRLSYQTYLTRLRAVHVQQFLKRVRPDPYPHGTAEAIMLALDAASTEDRTGLCQGLMNTISLLSEAGVPRTLLYAAAQTGFIGPSSPTMEVFSAQVDEAIGHLASASLLSFSVDGSTVNAHRLTMRVIRERQADQDGLVSLGTATIGLLDAVTQSLPEPWRHRLAARDALQQIIALNEHLMSHLGDEEDELRIDLLQLRAWVVWCVNDLGDDPRQAIEHGDRVLSDREQMLGDDHLDTLASRNNLAAAYRAAGRTGEAIPLYERTLAGYRRVLGDDHPDTLLSRNNLAAAYRAAGRTGEAISLYERTLADREQMLGDDHSSTLLSRNNLAAAYYAAGRTGEAISLYERTLADREQMLGDDHPDTLLSRNNLALAYQASGQASQAIPLLEKTLADRERVLGQDHPSTLTSQNNLAMVYHAAGRTGEAISLYERTLADRERVLGQDHPSTLTSQNNLAMVYHAAGRTGEAISLYERTLADRERVLGQDHPDTLLSRNNLATAYRAAWRTAEAIPLYEQAFAGRERVLGQDHPSTLTSQNNLAMVYHAAGRTAEAIPLYEQAFAGRERVLGQDHPSTLTSQNNLAMVYHAAGRTAEAIPLFKQAFAGRERVLGQDHSDTLTSLENLAAAYRAAGLNDEVISLRRQVLAGRERVLGQDHPSTLTSLENLAAAYRAARRTDEAIPLYEQAFAGRERVLGQDHRDTLTSLDDLAATYQAAGQAGKATSLAKRILADRERLLGKGHPGTLASRVRLALSYQAAGHTAKAIKLIRNTFTERNLELDNYAFESFTLLLDDLNLIFLTPKETAEVITFLEQIVSDFERTLGMGNPNMYMARERLQWLRKRAGMVNIGSEIDQARWFPR